MLAADASNTIFKLAADFVNNTSRSVFLTGKAGTGKTTFLKYIRENTAKRSVVIAPTGVAAINAGGVTMHSFFQLPLGPFIPGDMNGLTGTATGAADIHSLLKNIRFNADKRDLLLELELLIIDEVSMVRADMLDAMDCILRYFRKNMRQPFGGVQVLYIGDMYQLPPVVPDYEWDILKTCYDSPFFFSAKALAPAPPLYIELKKIYRQNDQLFIDVLNRVRNNLLTDYDFQLLNNRYQPGFSPAGNDKYITLSSHNRKADAINTAELEKLPGRMMMYRGALTGDFSDKAFPTELNLQLKEGAQVMFIKNDSGAERKFFNGKLATVKKAGADELIVHANHNGEELKVEKETWRNIRFSLNKKTNRIEETELGSFTQYPLRLAWAITIHKSQGLTFEKAIIDAGASFAPGQVYVALSRCTSLQGMVLHSRLYPAAIATDQRIIEFARKEAAAVELPQLLETEQQHYLENELVKRFNWKKVIHAVEQFQELIPGKKLPDIKATVHLAYTLLNKAQEQAAVAEKFQLQLQQLLQQVQQNKDSTVLEERMARGISWFIKSLWEDILQPLREHIGALQYAARVKKYVADATAIEASLYQHLERIRKTSYGDTQLCPDSEAYKPFAEPADPTGRKTAKKNKPARGDSQAESLALFKKGIPLAEIASLRQLAETTISGHLAAFVKTGELRVFDLLPEERVHIILPVVKEIGGDAVTPIKEILGDNFSYAEIRIVLNYWYWLQEEKVNA
ncbi:MAG: helix-turn-helix domain-containing protein [Bacteroidota bacterium]